MNPSASANVEAAPGSTSSTLDWSQPRRKRTQRAGVPTQSNIYSIKRAVAGSFARSQRRPSDSGPEVVLATQDDDDKALDDSIDHRSDPSDEVEEVWEMPDGTFRTEEEFRGSGCDPECN